MNDNKSRYYEKKSIKEATNFAIASTQTFIRLIFNALVTIYSIEFKIRGLDLKRDLLTHMITNLVINQDVYFILYNLIVLENAD
jgi:hypothetical protein